MGHGHDFSKKIIFLFLLSTVLQYSISNGCQKFECQSCYKPNTVLEILGHVNKALNCHVFVYGLNVEVNILVLDPK